MWGIKGENGTYFRGWTGLGTPYFGGDSNNAAQFPTKAEAETAIKDYVPRFIGSEFLFDNAEVVKLPKSKRISSEARQ